ncbi:MAG TPA: hypothetical protein VGF60_05870, partial [Xanthobacteraceae bacterium]
MVLVHHAPACRAARVIVTRGVAAPRTAWTMSVAWWEVGILHEDERFELVEGEMVMMAGKGTAHAACLGLHVCSAPFTTDLCAMRRIHVRLRAEVKTTICEGFRMPARIARDLVQRVPGEGRRSENLQGRKPRAMERGAADARVV